MIVDGIQWLVAGSIAIAIHLAGILWLTFATPAQETQPQPTSSEGIVVSLGTDARTTAVKAEAVSPSESAPVAAASEKAEEPASVATAVQAPEPAGDQVPTLIDLQKVDTAQAVAPQPVKTSAPSTPKAVRPRTVQARELTEAVSPQPETASVKTASESKPAVTRTVAASEAVEARPAEAPTEKVAQTVVSRAESTVEAGVAAPTKASDRAPASEHSETPAAVPELRKPPAVEVSSLPKAAVGVARVEQAGISKAVESVAAVRPSVAGSGTPLAPVAAKPVGEGSEVEVAKAQEPVAAARQGTEPALAEAAKPQTVDLENLEEKSGGSGVVARYAGVLKGWLQKNMHYPRAARLAGQQGEVVVRFIIDRNGKVQSIKLESRSGFPLLDREAKEMIERGDPFPAMPEEMPGQELEVRVPVSFHVKNETATKVIPPIYLK
ncbi:MAG: TonB family protein [Arenicellales bacterium]